MRVVADTNTLLSAVLWGGPPAAILGAARIGAIRLFTTAVLLDELDNVLRREKFSRRIAAIGATVPTLLTALGGITEIAQPHSIEPTCRDPDDDHVLACALGAGAVLIVTRDRDLLDLGTFRGIRILASHDALLHIAAAAAS